MPIRNRVLVVILIGVPLVCAALTAAALWHVRSLRSSPSYVITAGPGPWAAPYVHLMGDGDAVLSRWYVWEGVSAHFELSYGSTGRSALLLGVGGDDVHARMYDLDHPDTPRIELVVGEEPRIVLNDAAGRARVSLGLAPDGSGLLNILGEDGRVLWSAP